jgi:hypothetical protein
LEVFFNLFSRGWKTNKQEEPWQSTFIVRRTDE